MKTKWVVRAHHRILKHSPAKRAVDGTIFKEKTIGRQDKALVAEDAMGGPNPAQPQFLSGYNSHPIRRQGGLYAAQGPGLQEWCRRRQLQGSIAKTAGTCAVDSLQGTASHEGLVVNKGRRIQVANSRGTPVNHHSCNIGTARREVQTASSVLPDIRKLET